MMMPRIFGENLFDDFMNDFAFPDFTDSANIEKALYGKHAKNMMKTDVKDTENGYEVDIDLPGFKKDEITMKLENGTLTVSAAKGLDKDEEQKDKKYVRRERYAGAMSRSFYVGEQRITKRYFALMLVSEMLFWYKQPLVLHRSTRKSDTPCIHHR